jgi:hypothetical protein
MSHQPASEIFIREFIRRERRTSSLAFIEHSASPFSPDDCFRHFAQA